MRWVLWAITAMMGACSLSFAQPENVPTFGTTVVVPGGLLGVVYHISPSSKSLPYFAFLDPVGVIYTSSLNVPPRHFREGFPGVTDRFEWFAIDYIGRFWVEVPGTYQFALTSDDGSKLYIDDELIINNDGIHSPQVKMGAIALTGGIHRIRVSYFQGPRDEVALTLEFARPGESWRIFSTDEFKPPPDPETWHFSDSEGSSRSPIAQPELRVSPSAVSSGEYVTAEFVLRSITPAEIVGLKWNVIVPAQLLELVGDGPETAHEVENSVVKCSMEKIYLYACMLAGNPKPIQSGPIAIFHFKVRNYAESRTATFRAEKVEATAPDGRQFILNDAEGAVTIHKLGAGDEVHRLK